MTHALHHFKTVLATALFLSGCATLDSPLVTQTPDATQTAAAGSSDPESGKSDKSKTPESKNTPREIKGSVNPPPPKPAPPSHPSQVKPEGLIGATGKELIARFGQPNIT
ncbi:MAG: hypothetical protein HQL86_05705, partial [Magnetococcales bacterium]|nr:hypothetical protein [Magnetococcales bacterium]